jgi:hypothetical protein
MKATGCQQPERDNFQFGSHDLVHLPQLPNLIYCCKRKNRFPVGGKMVTLLVPLAVVTV